MGEQYTQFIDSFKSRRACIVVDDLTHQQRCALVLPAQDSSADEVNWAIQRTSGVVFTSLSTSRARSLQILPMTRPITSQTVSLETPQMGISVEAREGVTTGISAADRAATLRVLGEVNPSSRKLVTPGHIFPIIAKDGGVLSRPAIPEAALDIVVKAGYSDAAAIIDLVGTSGQFLSSHECRNDALLGGLPSISLSELTRALLIEQSLVTKVAEATLPTERAGTMRAIIYRSKLHEGEHLALVKGDLSGDAPVMTRVQGESTFSDVFGGDKESRKALQRSLKMIGEKQRGVIVYLRKSSQGYLKELVSTVDSQDLQKITLMREYGVGAQILRDLGVQSIELLTNSPKKLIGLNSFGIRIVNQLPLTKGNSET